MSYKIKFTAPANQDILKAIQYIAFSLNNPTAAVSLNILVQAKINSLPDFPEKYPLVNDISLAYQQIRYIPVDNYLIFYKINKNEIQILRFLYAKSNWLNILKTDKTNFNYPENLFEGKHYINEDREKY